MATTETPNRDRNVSDVRLKFFLARQMDGRIAPHGAKKTKVKLTQQQAAILALLQLLPEHATRKFQVQEIRQLVRASGFHKTVEQLREKKLMEQDEYRITQDGVDRLNQFADEVLGVPSFIEEKLRADTNYQAVIAGAGKMVDDYLRQKLNSISAEKQRAAAEP